jgi:hypothetical protein
MGPWPLLGHQRGFWAEWGRWRIGKMREKVEQFSRGFGKHRCVACKLIFKYILTATI